jgi:hypothetical protein
MVIAESVQENTGNGVQSASKEEYTPFFSSKPRGMSPLQRESA